MLTQLYGETGCTRGPAKRIIIRHIVGIHIATLQVFTMERSKLFAWLFISCLGRICLSHARTAERNGVRYEPGILTNNERIKRQTHTEPCTGVSCPGSSSGTTATEALAEQDQQAMCAFGINGNTLLRGRDGRDGRDGISGSDGQDGLRGETGSLGIVGDKGDRGDTGATGQDIPHPGNVGTSYVRWGRRTCPSTANLVYEGLAASGYYDHNGGGSSFLCLPYDPEYLQVHPGEQGRATIYSTEYQMDGFPPLTGLHNQDVSCAVCRVSRRGTKLMIPAKIQCPSDWTEEYQGYLMTAHYGHPGPKEYLCVDENAEPTSNSNTADHNGALLYPVEARCSPGNLPCRPYINGDELACVVCTF